MYGPIHLSLYLKILVKFSTFMYDLYTDINANKNIISILIYIAKCAHMW